MWLSRRTIPGGVATLVLSTSIWLHCGSARGSLIESERNAMGKERTVAGDSILISLGRVGPVQVCDSLGKVNIAFRGYVVRDTVYHAEQSRWPGKRVFLSDGIIEFSTSWADTGRVWNISTTSPSVRSPRGFHVGMRLGEVLRVDSVTVDLPEGAVVLTLAREGIGALIDRRSQEQFYGAYKFKGTPTVAMLNPDATITALVTGGACK